MCSVWSGRYIFFSFLVLYWFLVMKKKLWESIQYMVWIFILSCWYLIFCIKGLCKWFSVLSWLHMSAMFQYKLHYSVSSVAECLLRIRQEKLLHHCIIKLKASLLLVSTYTQHMASSTKHNLTATTCITIKTLEKSFERKNQSESALT